MNHTPGEWIVVATPESSNQNFIVKACTEGFRLGDERGRTSIAATFYDRNEEANALIISAAPNLLAECKEALRVAKSWHENHGHHIECDMLCARIPPLISVIRKAEGQ